MELFDEMYEWIREWLRVCATPEASLKSLGLSIVGLWGYCPECHDQWALWAGDGSPHQFLCPGCGKQWIRVIRAEIFP